MVSKASDLTLRRRMKTTLFEKLGGAAAVDLAVDKFYE
jgi:truncated hemoglobin YjbI